MSRKTDVGGSHTEAEPYIGQLIEKLPAFDPGWSDEIKSKWFDDFLKLLKRTGSESSSSKASGQDE